MIENNPSLLFIEKKLENDYSTIIDDYNMLNEIYPDDIKVINNNSDELHFLIKLNQQIKVQQSTIELLYSMKLEDLLDENETNYITLPYWIKILYSYKNKILRISIFIFWFKYEKDLIKQIKEKLSKNIEEPILYNIIEEIKYLTEDTLTDKQMLIDLLKEIRDLKALKVQTNTLNFLLVETEANKDIEDFRYKDDNLKHQLDNHIEQHINNKSDEIKEIKENKESKKDEEENKNYNYEKFLKDKGLVGETIIDRASTFQAHIIKIKNKEDAQFYKKCLLNQKKIKKATHNITIYRYINEDTNQVVEDYNDDGEDGAGYRLLGVIQKMKLVNIFVMVSRWFGGTLLHQDRFKRINDSAKNLINQHLDSFDKCD